MTYLVTLSKLETVKKLWLQLLLVCPCRKICPL